jgi:hypothetical protein
LFLSVRGFSDYAGPAVHSRLRGCRVAFLLLGMTTGFSQLNRPAHRCLWSTLQETPRDVSCKTRGQDGFANSFPVGLLHPLQHAGLPRRTPVCPSSAQSEPLLLFGYFEHASPPLGFQQAQVYTSSWKPNRRHETKD